MTAQKWPSSGLSLFKHTQGEVTKVTELESEVRMQVYATDTKVAQQECRKKRRKLCLLTFKTGKCNVCLQRKQANTQTTTTQKPPHS